MSRLAAAVLVAVCASTLAIAATPLSFRIDEGHTINSFVRDRDIAAHLLLRSGRDPRILVAFPAGNSGVGLWFAKTATPVTWTLLGEPRATTLNDGRGRALRGIVAEATVDAAALQVDRAVLSSVRVLRNYQAAGTVAAELLVTPLQRGNGLSWSRDRLDGAAGYRLTIEALDGASVSGGTFAARAGQPLRLKILALTGELPLTPIDPASLFTAQAGRDPRARNVLTYLSYRQKYLAGSWRFDTYFGRDTLMSLALLAPVLQRSAVESGLTSVLARLSPAGEVAHEEAIGEFAVLENMKEGRGPRARPIYDYGMVDEDFMLAPVTAHWLLEEVGELPQTRAFLASRVAAGVSAGDALVQNFEWVVRRSADFAASPSPANLVGLKPGRQAGQWRDSNDGLGGGRYPYDVNAVFVPAALNAIDGLLQSGLLDPYLSPAQRRVLMRAHSQFLVWSEHAPPLFEVTVPADAARAGVSGYARSLGIDPTAALASLGNDAVAFNALSLDGTSEPVPVMHSDDGFALLFGMPSATQLARSIDAVVRPFPAGLWTPIGVLVANPAFADSATQSRFTRNAYHGTVVWAWQQAVLAAGLRRQLMRADLSPEVRVRLARAQDLVETAIAGASEVRTSELWSWSFAKGCYRLEPFGERGEDVDESNAAQLWSTVYLALPPLPARTADIHGLCRNH